MVPVPEECAHGIEAVEEEEGKKANIVVLRKEKKKT